MKKNNDLKSTLQKSALHERAEMELKKNGSVIPSDTSEHNMQKLLHELEVYEMELELKNGELRDARDRAEAAASKYVSLYDFAPIGYFTLDKNGTIVQINFAGAKLLGKERSFLINSSFKTFITQNTLAVFNAFINRIFESATTQNCEIELQIKDMPVIIIFVEGIFLSGSNECLITTINITNQKQSEQVLKESEKRFRLFYERAPLSYHSLDKNGCIIDVNPAWLQFLGYSRDEVIGHYIGEFMTTPSVRLLPQRFKSFIEKGEAHDYQFELIHKDGTIFKVSHNGKIGYDANNHFQQTYCIFKDITHQEREEAELREREFFFKESQRAGNVGSYKFIINANQWTSSAVLDQIFGIDNHYQRTLEGWLDLIHPDDREIMDKYFQEEVIIKGLTFNKEYRIIRPSDGQLRWVHGIGQQSYNGESQISEMYGIVQDITERKDADHKILDLNEQLKALNATKDKFFSIIAHDLRNPFISIIGFSNILSEQIAKKDEEGIVGYAEIIHDSAERALLLLTNLFQWARSQTGKLTFSPEKFDLVAVIDDVIKLKNDTAFQKSITLTREGCEKTMVCADKNMISTILRNLISNAIKFTKTGGKVEVNLIKGKNELLVTVRDNGVGIRENDLYKLWRIDENFSTKGTNKETGTGLGLILCKEFVEKHGGKIWVESKINQGSSFYFTIPCRKQLNNKISNVAGKRKNC